MSNQIVQRLDRAIQTESLAEFVKEFVSNGNLSIRGLAAMCGVADTAIIRGADFKSDKLAERLTAHGFEGADLASNGFPPEAVWLVLEYFAYDSKAEAPYAKAIARTFGAYGVKAAFRDAETEPMNQFDYMRQQILLMEEQARELKRIGAEVQRVISPYGDHFSAMAYLSLQDCVVADLKTASKLGRLASKLCREQGIAKGEVSDPRFGKVGTYPASVLDDAFDSM